MHKPAPLHSAALCATLLAAAAILSHAGPLDPPPGPITSTYKTLTEVEPRIAINSTNTPGDVNSRYRITAPGSYYLTGNLVGVAGDNGIDIASSDVTIDLMGFTVQAVAGSSAGIVTEGVYNNITVRNGVVTGWAGAGVDLLAGGAGAGSLIESICATNNSGVGIQCNHHGVIRSCVARANNATNIVCGTDGLIESCVAEASISGHGIGTASGCAVRSCTCNLNAFDGILTGAGSTVTDCSASDNSDDGISVGTSCTVTGCTSYNNNGNGTAAGSSSTVSACTSYSNNADGFAALSGSTVSGCTSGFNAGDGIQVSTDCRVAANQCDNNGTVDGAGIHATSSDNRIEGNNVTDNPRGIDVDAGGNLIIRNSASGNTTNYDVVVSNYGQYISAVSSAAVLGAAGGVSIGTTDPWANLSY